MKKGEKAIKEKRKLTRKMNKHVGESKREQ